MKIVVTGGCGYIGSHTLVDLIQSGYDVVSIDNGINSSFDVLDGIEAITGVRVTNINADLSDTALCVDLLRSHAPFGGIIHFAALKRVEESVYQPLRYFKNNVGGTLTTMALMSELNIPHLIFSSSCTVYGSPAQLPVDEDTPMGKAENPYGATKQTGEILYRQYFKNQRSPSSLSGLGQTSSEQRMQRSGISLRYFNPAGAHPSGLIGEASRDPSTNLVPIIAETAIGKRKELMVYGDDYNTRDGSCIRDFIHITDLARAHTLALAYLLEAKNEEPYEVFNLGMGEGVTVLEAIHAFEAATGIKINYRIGARRPGDVPAIYADNLRIRNRLGWQPTQDMKSIMRSAWQWEQKRT